MTKNSLNMRSEINILVSFVMLVLLVAGPAPGAAQAASTSSSPVRRVNVPELTNKPFTPAIFWFGKVDGTNNYTDVRVWYYDPYYVEIVLHNIDRQLWYDPAQNISQLTQYDSASIYINIDGNIGSSPGTHSYRFEIQLASNLKASFQGNSSGWNPASIPFNLGTDINPSDQTGWWGYLNTGKDSEGWVAYFLIPFSSLGLDGAPPAGSTWGLGIKLHDRDNDSVFHETQWPEALNPNAPSTWGQLSFGIPSYTRPASLSTGSITIRKGLNGVEVPDGEVGGHTTCGNDGLDKWDLWGDYNYNGYTQINIQNQWNIDDWPCFSKYYITFPLPKIPSGKILLSAQVTMYLFGGSGYGWVEQPPNSYIQVLSVAENWDPASITWNTAPYASQNISGTWVYPVDTSEGVPYSWNVSLAAANALASGTPLRLVFYSADSDMHSGKYFFSSEWDNPQMRPTLFLIYGVPCTTPGIDCHFSYLPLLQR